MKKSRTILFSLAALIALALFCSAAFEQTKAPRLAVVNFKKCVEKSKVGQKEQSAFDNMKKQMEKILQEKEKALADVAGQYNDINYLDSLSPEAEAKLKQQYRTLTQEFTQTQNQFYQQLGQANMTIVQKLQDKVTKSAEEVAKKNQIDLVLSDEGTFFVGPALDISNLVVQVLDEKEKEAPQAKENEVPAADMAPSQQVK